MTKNLRQILNIKKGDVISITGSGGKTSLMESLGQELKNYGRVLLTTSTKIRRPRGDFYDYIFDSFDDYKKPTEDKALAAMGDFDPSTNKFHAIEEDKIKKIKDDFDYILIEADGSRMLPLKMWKSYEPVIYNISSKVLGVFPAKVIGRKVEEDFIYNYQDFKNLIGEDKVDKEVFLKLITSKPGPFGDYKGEKIVFFNQVDGLEDKEKVDEIIQYLRESTKDIRYLAGSVLKEEYYED